MSGEDDQRLTSAHQDSGQSPRSSAQHQSPSIDTNGDSSSEESGPIQIKRHLSPSEETDSPNIVDQQLTSSKDSPYVLDRNPSPPTVQSDQDEERLHAVIIKDTVFSKHWVFTTLMTLIKEAGKEDPDGGEGESSTTEEKEPATQDDSENSTNVAPIELDKDLENELCRLWDMSMNKEVAIFLHQWKMVDILIRVIETTNAPRATEICVGILANMACNEEIVVDISNREELITVVLALLECSDPPTLIETTRLIYTCVSNTQSATHWLAALKKISSIPTTICFILQSSTNNDLIHNMSDLLDKLLDMDDELLTMWSSSNLLIALCEASEQVRGERPTALEFLLHALQLLSTTEKGAAALMENGDTVFRLIADFLHSVCTEETITVIGKETELAASVSILDTLTTSNDSGVLYLEKDSRITRDLVDIVHILRSQLRQRRKSSLSEEEQKLNTSRAHMLENVILNYMGSLLKSKASNGIICKQLKKCEEGKVRSLKSALKKSSVDDDVIQSLEWEM
ncbi:protein saal1-like [Ptychodera flava]|uniref:protein saal1-like n=1 Tax=Ptychodera flava TaxID=63121 RepID=UPI003969C235